MSPAAPQDVADLDAGWLTRTVSGKLWRSVEVLAETTSTNADLAARARSGEPEGLVLVADHQTAGRGRLGRSWTAPPGSALLFSMLLRPGTEPARWPMLGLIVALAVASAVHRTADVRCGVKWPNDVQVGELKLAGILTERHHEAVVVGTGLNLTAAPPAATCLADHLRAPAGSIQDRATASAPDPAADRTPDRAALLAAILAEIAVAYRRWLNGDDLLADYRERSVTIGRRVRVQLPSGRVLAGIAEDIDPYGRLVVASTAPDGRPDRELLAAGDVLHVRPAQP